VTETTRVPPADANDSVVEDSDAVHGAAACVIVSSFPPIAMVPVLVVPAAFAATRYVTVPSPEPLAPVRTVIHEALEVAVQAQPDGRLTSTLPSAPAAAMFCVAGVSVASHVAPACVMTNGWPATVSVVDRELLLVFAATLNPTLPLPVPDVGVLNVTHEALFWTFQKQARPAVTVIVPVPALADSEALAGEMLYPQLPNWVIVTACPATVSTPERDCVVGFAVTE
jgi:hypothetical protein